MGTGPSSDSRGRVFDASALLAYLKGEPGAALARRWVSTGFVSAVNWSEVLQKSAIDGRNVAQVAKLVHWTGLAVVSFDEEMAARAAELFPVGRSIGMSFADRACIATAAALGLTVLTADRRWSEISLPVEVAQLR